MKKKTKVIIGVILAGLVLILLITNTLVKAGKASDVYLGKWYVINAENEKMIVEITHDTITVSTRKYKLEEFDSGVKGKKEYYKFRIDDTDFALVYNDKNDKDTAVLLVLGSSKEVKGAKEFSMSRIDYPEKY